MTEEPKPGLHWTRWMDSEGLSITGIHVFEIAPPLHQQEAPTVQIHFFFASLSVVSRLMTSFWCVWKRKQHFLFQTLFSSQTAVLPKSFSSVFNVFIKDVFVNLWSGLVFSSLFFWYRLEPEKKAGRESQLHLDSTSQPVGFTPHFWRTKSKVQAYFQSHLLNWDTWFNSSLFSVCSTFIRFRMFHFVCNLL